jgi:hypothetical protein
MVRIDHRSKIDSWFTPVIHISAPGPLGPLRHRRCADPNDLLPPQFTAFGAHLPVHGAATE